jgi:hypothetical protein
VNFKNLLDERVNKYFIFLLFNEKNILVSNSRTNDYIRLKRRHIAGCWPLLKFLEITKKQEKFKVLGIG